MPNPTDIPVTRQAAHLETAATGWGGLGSLLNEMERLFDTFEPRLWFDRGPRLLRGSGGAALLCPALDLSETEEAYHIETELPGISFDQITVKLTDGTITISGEKSEEQKQDDTTWHLRERRWGRFQRSLRLPPNVDADAVHARFDSGLLTIILPKTAAARASERAVAVEVA